jgi:hypothetical protein
LIFLLLEAVARVVHMVALAAAVVRQFPERH